ncbi:acylneuraminate cytidylyltransferase family protein [Hyphobacterium sp. HN65]|uniref:Acylneuraminate cytidylyltransferase family protein n=1 Tax=Hyphobacterium lacteum TaxID=3116575 RepID=A0ABU7LQL7_9PROT|nr:acylneuraminate cytidylyltransferase family protein [Hyphobacterium sp. HN65]MEE2526204.1 acylneuraminate cytidylyltransferase family protein [Hyphobacterium sp. HN65]
MSRRIAIIPARGGSKRIPRKNIRPFGGQPALTHILKSAEATGLFDTIHVSTDDPEIAAVAGAAGHRPDFLREAAIADDFTPIRTVMGWTLREYKKRGNSFETAALLYATAFFVEPDDIAGAVREFETRRTHPVLAVTPVGTAIEKLFVEQGGLLKTADEAKFASRTQDLTPAFQDAGAFGIFSAPSLLAEEDGAKPLHFRPFLLDRLKAIDIDTEDDWAFAERLHAARKRQ